ncbi:MAG: hypothetical protein ACLQUY_28820 [Ktedonobacterales bacterium]
MLGFTLLGSAVLLSGCGATSAGTGTTSTPTVTTAPTTVPFKVSSVDLVVSPSSIAGSICGTSAAFTYTATFHVPAGTAGGTIQFSYTLNNGRGQTSASVAVAAGQTTQTYTFSSSGTLPADHTYPGIAEVLVSSPNAVTSPQVQVSGSCGTATAAFQVTSITMAVSPTTIAGDACGTQITVTYTATFHIASGSPGGTIDFVYTWNNGRATPSANVIVGPGQTMATYTFTQSGPLPADHTFPGLGGVITSSPNVVSSPMVQPDGECS